MRFFNTRRSEGEHMTCDSVASVLTRFSLTGWGTSARRGRPHAPSTVYSTCLLVLLLVRNKTMPSLLLELLGNPKPRAILSPLQCPCPTFSIKPMMPHILAPLVFHNPKGLHYPFQGLRHRYNSKSKCPRSPHNGLVLPGPY